MVDKNAVYISKIQRLYNRESGVSNALFKLMSLEIYFNSDILNSSLSAVARLLPPAFVCMFHDDSMGRMIFQVLKNALSCLLGATLCRI